jgi:hypothetical protein
MPSLFTYTDLATIGNYMKWRSHQMRYGGPAEEVFILSCRAYSSNTLYAPAGYQSLWLSSSGTPYTPAGYRSFWLRRSPQLGRYRWYAQIIGKKLMKRIRKNGNKY